MIPFFEELSEIHPIRFVLVGITAFMATNQVIPRVSTPILGVPRENDTPELSSPYLSCRENPRRNMSFREIATLTPIAIERCTCQVRCSFSNPQSRPNQLQRTMKVHRSLGVISSPRLREDKLSRGIPITFSESHRCISMEALWISPFLTRRLVLLRSGRDERAKGVLHCHSE